MDLATRAKRIAKYEKNLAEVKCIRDGAQEKLRPPVEKPIAQRVLTESFCVNRLKEIRQFAGNSKLKDFTTGYEREVREEEISRIFKDFDARTAMAIPLTSACLRL